MNLVQKAFNYVRTFKDKPEDEQHKAVAAVIGILYASILLGGAVAHVAENLPDRRKPKQP